MAKDKNTNEYPKHSYDLFVGKDIIVTFHDGTARKGKLLHHYQFDILIEAEPTAKEGVNKPYKMIILKQYIKHVRENIKN